MPNIGVPELIVVLVIALLVLGPGKLPEVGASLGKTIREFRKASTELEETANINAPAPNRLASQPPAAERALRHGLRGDGHGPGRDAARYADRSGRRAPLTDALSRPAERLSAPLFRLS